MNTSCLGLIKARDLVPGLHLQGEVPTPSFGTATMRRMEASGVDVTAHLDNVTATVENFRRATKEERAEAFLSLSPQDRPPLLAMLPEDLKTELKEAEAEYYRAKYERNKLDAVMVLNICAASHSSFLLMDSLLEHYAYRMLTLCETHKVEKRYPFKIKKHVTSANVNRKKTYSMCLKLEGGVLLRMMTMYLPHWQNEYDDIGIFTAASHQQFMKHYKDRLDSIYEQAVAIAEARNPELKELAANTLMAYISAQLVCRALNTGNNSIYKIRKFTKNIIYLPEPKPSHDFADATENMLCLFFKGKDWANEVAPVVNAMMALYEEARTSDAMEDIMKPIIADTISNYTDWYFAKMVLVAKDKEGMPQGVKDDINILFGSTIGYCRVMKDVKACARLIKATTHDEKKNKIPDCALNAKEEIADLIDSGTLRLPALQALRRRVFEARGGKLDMSNAERLFEKIKKHY